MSCIFITVIIIAIIDVIIDVIICFDVSASKRQFKC